MSSYPRSADSHYRQPGLRPNLCRVSGSRGAWPLEVTDRDCVWQSLSPGEYYATKAEAVRAAALERDARKGI